MVNKIKQLRMGKHLSQEQLAEKAKVSVRTIQRLEAGEDAKYPLTVNRIDKNQDEISKTRNK